LHQDFPCLCKGISLVRILIYLVAKAGVAARQVEKPAIQHANAAKPVLSGKCMIPRVIICLA
jgi:hypothetical protein